MRKKTIKSYIDSLPPEVVAYRIRLGTGRNVPTISIVAIENSDFVSEDAGIIYCKSEEVASVIEEIAIDAGWGEEETTIRLHALNKKNKSLGTWQLTKKNPIASKNDYGTSYSIGALTDGILSMSAQLTRTIDILTESLAHSETSRAHMFEALLEAREDQLAAEGEALISTIDHGPAEPDPFKMRAMSTLENVAAAFVGGTPGETDNNYTAEDVMNRAKQDIWFAQDLAAEYQKTQKTTEQQNKNQDAPEQKTET
jgi:hypothetical protein